MRDFTGKRRSPANWRWRGLLLLVNLATVTQDIATDGLSVRLLLVLLTLPVWRFDERQHLPFYWFRAQTARSDRSARRMAPVRRGTAEARASLG